MKKWQTTLAVGFAAIIAPLAARAAELPADQVEFFEKKIRPVLANQCLKCHGGEKDKVKGQLLLTSREAILKGGETGPAVIPGDPDKSLLIKAIRYHDEELQMPPKARLTDAQVNDFVTWVRMGAPDPRTGPELANQQTNRATFWSLVPPRMPAHPDVKRKDWAKNELDEFVLAAMEGKKLSAVGTADRLTLIRRATFDLTGLPPTPEEIQSFLSDPSPSAYEQVIDQLLASPAYGERWGRHWLDVAHYADTAGESADYPIPQAYLYRNYVIDSFNQDKPYDQFIKEQLAGDLLPSSSPEQWKQQTIATGFVAMARRFSVQPEYAMHLTYEDTIDTVGKSMLGLTISCARCHDHKFDPISSKDYYALYGIFSSTRYPYPGSEEAKIQKDFVPLISEAEVEQLKKPIADKLAALDDEIAQYKQMELDLRQARQAARQAALASNAKTQPQAALVVAAPSTQPARKIFPKLTDINAIHKKIDDAQRKKNALLPIPMAYAVAEGKPSDARVQKRGEPGQQGDLVPRGFPQVLGGQKVKDVSKSGRLELANWIASTDNPLTARVMVNRIWQYHFGQGLVQTPNDFGARGKPPTHPQLLDYLALKFIESGWSIKSMHRMIMLSQTYQLSSELDERCAEIDPNDEYLWHFPRRRLDAEEIRDSILAVSGQLDRTQGGAHPFPAESKWGFTQHNAFSAVYETNRRSVYMMQQRIKKHPFLAMWDGPDPNTSTAVRGVSMTPIQALFMMNSEFVANQAEKFAQRLEAERGDDRLRVERAIWMLYGRAPYSGEVDAAIEYLRQYEVKLPPTTRPAEEKRKSALASYLHVLMCSNEFFFVN